MTRFAVALLLPGVFLSGCSDDEFKAGIGVPIVVIEEEFTTPRKYLTLMDSPAIWRGQTGETWIVATGKLVHRLYVSDAATGAHLRTVGRRGTDPGEFRRPNGIAIVGDIAMVVERDVHRVQLLRMPDFAPLATFGEETLVTPYGIAVQTLGNGQMMVFITDDYQVKGDSAPPDRELGHRVKRYLVADSGQGWTFKYLGAFGDTVGPGRLIGVESIAVDPDAGILLVADELAIDVKVYRTDGTFTGQVLWKDLIRTEPEGIVLYACGPSEGYWVVTDQHPKDNRFLVFDRKSFALLGAFRGATVTNTDGIALIQRPVGEMSAGAVYAANKDRSVSAISWSKIAAALKLRADCVQ
jgi:3-phytase